MEKGLRLIEHVKSGLRSFMLEISHWTMLHGRADQLKLIAIKPTETLTENNQPYTRQERADILKISESIKLLVKMRNVSVISQKKRNGLFGQTNSIHYVG